MNFLALIPFIALAAPPAPGSEDARAMQGHEAWIERQKNAAGQLCCDVSDSRPVEVRSRDGHYEVKFLRSEELPKPYPYGWLPVPDAAILRDADGHPIPSPVGLSVAWYFGGVIRCFTIPTGG